MEQIKPRLQKMIRKHQLKDYTGLGNTAIDEEIKSGRFPKGVRLTKHGRAVAWPEDVLIKYQQDLLSNTPK